MSSTNFSDTKTFPNISAKAFQHPSDIAATQALRAVPLLDTVQKWFLQNTSERAWNLHVLASGVRLGPNQGARIYNAFVHAASILDLPKLPSIYLLNSADFNAFASGVENYSVTLTAGLVDALDEEELLAVIGHELGHIKCEHMLYKSLARNMSSIGLTLLNRFIPGLGSMAAMPLLSALLYWSRMAEFSCDRAALLVTQNLDVVKRTTVMLAAGSKKILPDLNIDDVLKQADEYLDVGMGAWDKLLIFEREMKMTHPVPVLRCKEIHQWGNSEEYQEILGGTYTKKGEEPPEEPSASKKDGASEEGSIFSSITNIFQKKDPEEKQEGSNTSESSSGGSFWNSVSSVFKKEPASDSAEAKTTESKETSDSDKDTTKKDEKKGRIL